MCILVVTVLGSVFISRSTISTSQCRTQARIVKSAFEAFFMPVVAGAVVSMSGAVRRIRYLKCASYMGNSLGLSLKLLGELATATESDSALLRQFFRPLSPIVWETRSCLRVFFWAPVWCVVYTGVTMGLE